MLPAGIRSLIFACFAATFIFVIASQCEPSRRAEILDIPILPDAHCFWQTAETKQRPECRKFYADDFFACPKFYNPVFDAAGIFYPSACWAEHFGIANYEYGISEPMLTFMRDLWRIPTMITHDVQLMSESAFLVPHPNIEFSYSGGGIVGWRSGTLLRSFLWRDDRSFVMMSFNINTDATEQFTREMWDGSTIYPVHGSRRNLLQAYIMFDPLFPSDTLVDWTLRHTPLINQYLKTKQQVPSAVQFNIDPVVISPPLGLPARGFLSNSEIELIYTAALAESGNPRGYYDGLIVTPVARDTNGGYYHPWHDGSKTIDLLYAALRSDEYSELDQRQALNAFKAFEESVLTVSHEILHALGLPGDHIPMEYGTTFLGPSGLDVDPITGHWRGEQNPCDFLGQSPDYFAVELPFPAQLMFRVGGEPNWLLRIESVSGPCLIDSNWSKPLKDIDRDGTYEMMYANNLIGIEIQQALGWVDIDGDAVSELVDANPYGGFSLRNPQLRGTAVGPDNDLFSFSELGRVRIDDCTFEQVRLENGTEGLVAFECAEFNDEITNLYRRVRYNWAAVDYTDRSGNPHQVLIPNFASF